MSLTVKNVISSITPLHDSVIVSEMNFKERITSGGIVLLSDDGRTAGIRPRWGQVYAVGPKQRDVKVGDWVCVAHGRWTRGVEIEDASGMKTIALKQKLNSFSTFWLIHYIRIAIYSCEN